MENNKTPYLKFFVMLLVSGIIMYFIMFLNIFQINHYSSSLTRLYMTLLMVAPMAITMLLFMWKMYNNKKLNIVILITSSCVFLVSLFFLRNQAFISDVQWMKAMIPHHSSAILTSSNAKFENEKVQKLATDIIETQKREIDMMKKYINEIENQ